MKEKKQNRGRKKWKQDGRQRHWGRAGPDPHALRARATVLFPFSFLFRSFFFCYCSFCFLFFFQHVFRHSMEFNFNRWRYTATGHAARDPPSSVTRDLICALPVELLNELAVCGAWAGSAVPDELLAGAQQRRSLHRLRPPAAAPLGSPAASDNAPRALLVPTRVARRRIAIQ